MLLNKEVYRMISYLPLKLHSWRQEFFTTGVHFSGIQRQFGMFNCADHLFMSPLFMSPLFFIAQFSLKILSMARKTYPSTLRNGGLLLTVTGPNVLGSV